MSSKYPYPSIEPNGLWETDSLVVLDRVFTDFYTCDASQSFLEQRIPSMASIVAEFQNDLEKMMTAIKFALESIFGDYFKTATAYVTHSNAAALVNKAELTMQLMIIDSTGTEINIGKIFSIEGSKISLISNLIQG